MRRNTEEERLYRIQRQATRDGVNDYVANALFKKFVINPILGLILFAIIFNIYWANEKVRIPAKNAKFRQKQAEKTMLYKQLEQCKKTGDPKRQKCSDIWWKWVRK